MSQPFLKDQFGSNPALNDRADFKVGSDFSSIHVQKQVHRSETIGKVDKNDEIEYIHQKSKENSRLQNERFESSDKEKKEENTNQIGLLKKESSKEKQVKSKEEIYPDSQNSIQIEQGDQKSPSTEFKVYVHQVQSRQSLYQNADNHYEINFTKSEMNIPLQYMGSEEEDLKKSQQKLAQIQGAKTEGEEGEDFYVKYLEDKWAKRQNEQAEMNKLIEGLQHEYQHSKTTQNSIARSENLEKQKILPNPSKKAQFKVKKVKDRPLHSTNYVRSLNTSSQIRAPKPQQNQSEVIGSKPNELKPYKYNREGKKHLSNFETMGCTSKNSFYKQQSNENVQYEISLSNSVEMMSHILEDRCYNILNHKKTNSIGTQNHPKDEAVNKVRKIIKRSPYGILEIEVKDKKNSARITNLRILKPKQMIRLKKIPNLIKGNKENCLEKSQSKVSENNSNFVSQKQYNQGQGQLPLLSYNRK